MDSLPHTFDLPGDLSGNGSAENQPTEWLVLLGLLALLAAAIVLQWRGPYSIAIEDGISYITGGLNLVRHGVYQNTAGEPELWFPPLYPLLIGIVSLGGRFDPVTAGRLISAAASAATVVVLFRMGRSARIAYPALCGGIAAACLVLNPVFQAAAAACLSEATATALLFATFALWASAPIAQAGPRRLISLGALAGAGYLVRPETILLLPLWALVDFAVGPRDWRTIRRYSLAAAACVVVVAPYVAWLSANVGRITLSNKSEINLSIGREQYYGRPDWYIDPAALEMKFGKEPPTQAEEIRRYGHNLVLLGADYAAMYRGLPASGMLALVIVGAAVLVGRRDRRLLLGIAAQFVYLLVVARYAVFDRYLHATLPALCLLAGIGAEALFLAVRSPERGRLVRLVSFVVLAVTGLSLAEAGSRQPRWAVTGGQPPTTLLRDAGLAFKASGLPPGDMYEYGAAIGYYAGETRRRLWSDDLDTVLRYAAKHERPGIPCWIAVSTLQASNYHPSVRSLLDDTNAGPLVRAFEMSDPRGKVVIYRLP